MQRRIWVLNGVLEQTFRDWHPGFRLVGTKDPPQRPNLCRVCMLLRSGLDIDEITTILIGVIFK
jgi:hypothetical protein